MGGVNPSTSSTITKVNVRIPSDRITGPDPEVYVRASAAGSGSWEKVTGDITSSSGAEHTFTGSGPQIDMRILGSGTVLSGLASDGRIVPVIYCTVVETA